jgi:protease I
MTMKVLILSADEFEDLELFYPLYRMKEEGIATVLASPKRGIITGKHGYAVKADASTLGHSPRNFDALIIPGGKAPEVVRQDPNAVKTAGKFMEEKKPVAAICHGIQVLISADVLKGRRVTCWPGVADDATAAGAVFEDAEVVVDGNLITSRMPSDLPAFCRELFKQLSAAEAEEKKAA